MAKTIIRDFIAPARMAKVVTRSSSIDPRDTSLRIIRMWFKNKQCLSWERRYLDWWTGEVVVEKRWSRG